MGLAASLALLVGIVFVGVGWFSDDGNLRNTLVILGTVSSGVGVLTFVGLWVVRKLRAR